MATIISRTFRSTPHRRTTQTWEAIVSLLTRGNDNQNKRELLSVSGIAASVIADQYLKNSPLVVTCEGPRTRIYCIYDEAAMDEAGANEDSLGFDPLSGDWRVSLPCHKDDLDWVQAALKKHSTKITARDMNDDAVSSVEKYNNSQSLTLDPEGFLRS